MFKKFTKSDNRGFTIVEVMFVLAIAALIMLIVFLAVPALQRNSRNTGRKTDAGRFNSAIADYVSNNNGTFPDVSSAANWQTACNAIAANAGTLSQYTSSDVTCTGAAVTGGATQGKFNGATGAATFTAPASGQSDALVFDVSATCPTTGLGGTSITTVSGNARQAVLLYTVENSSAYVWNCEAVD